MLILEKQIFHLDQMKNGSRELMLDVYKEEIRKKKKIKVLNLGLWNLMLILRAVEVSTRGAVSHKTGIIPILQVAKLKFRDDT